MLKKVWSIVVDENEEGTETEEKEAVVYNITSEVKFFNVKVNRCVERFGIYYLIVTAEYF